MDPMGTLGVIQLMEEILHQLVGSLSQYLQLFFIPGGAGSLPSTEFVGVDLLEHVCGTTCSCIH